MENVERTEAGKVLIAFLASTGLKEDEAIALIRTSMGLSAPKGFASPEKIVALTVEGLSVADATLRVGELDKNKTEP